MKRWIVTSLLFVSASAFAAHFDVYVDKENINVQVQDKKLTVSTYHLDLPKGVVKNFPKLKEAIDQFNQESDQKVTALHQTYPHLAPPLEENEKVLVLDLGIGDLSVERSDETLVSIRTQWVVNESKDWDIVCTLIDSKTGKRLTQEDLIADKMLFANALKEEAKKQETVSPQSVYDKFLKEPQAFLISFTPQFARVSLQLERFSFLVLQLPFKEYANAFNPKYGIEGPLPKVVKIEDEDDED